MKHARLATAFLSTAAIAAALAAAAPSAAAPQKKPPQKKLYCWEEGGRKICGDALPADAADNARREFSARTGRQVGEVARALTDEERAALDADTERAEQAAKEEAERARRELAMVESYSTEDELRRAFRNRIVLMDDKVQATRVAIASLRQALVTRLRSASELELAGKPVPADLSSAIATQHRAVSEQRALLASQQAERAALDTELESAVARYRELTGAAEAAPPDAGEVQAGDAASEG